MKNLKFHFVTCLLLLAGLLLMPLLARPEDGGPQGRSLVFLEVSLNSPARLPRLKTGDVLEAEVVRNAFSGYRLVLPAGTQVSLRVSGMERRRKEFSDKWPWPAEYFRSKSEKFPTFDLLTASLPQGGNASFPVSFACAYNELHLTARTVKEGESGDFSQGPTRGENQLVTGKKPPGSRLEVVVEATPHTGGVGTRVAADSASLNKPSPKFKRLAAGTETKLALVDRLSASRGRAGDIFSAILVEPLLLKSGKMVPQGTLLEGRVGKSTPPRWLSRPGSLYLTFNRLVLPSGASIPIAASIVGVETSRNARMKVHSEGELSGGSPGKKRLLVDAGVAFGISKVADDGFQLIAEALVSTATDASTAGTARLIGMGIGSFLFIRRRGRDVVLPPYTLLRVRFDRSPKLRTIEKQHQSK